MMESVNNCVSKREEVKKGSKSTRIALKSKENVKKESLKKSINKKLKKYKLRKDGKDDPDVLDISQCLSSTLTIISPVAKNNDLENFKMRNKTNSSPCKSKSIECNSKVESSSKEQRKVTPSNTFNSLSVENSPQDVSKKKNKEEAVSNETLTDSQKVPENKHINAFQVMMTARHKSIGGNSPGKDNKDSQEVIDNEIEKKELKVRRKLALQKMADLKGGTEKSEVEANKDLYIKQELDKRALRLKEMLVKNNKNNRQIENICQQDEKIEKNDRKHQKGSLKNKVNYTSLSPSRQSKLKNEKPQTILNLVRKTHSSPENIKHKVDDDFLKNLSPSIKKKESMLSYFEKTDKKVILNDDEFNSSDHETELTLIKVKFTPKTKKTKLKKKNRLLKLKEENVKEENCKALNCGKAYDIHIKYDNEEKEQVEPEKSKNELEFAKSHSEIITISPRSSLRPKRNVKRPIKYLSDSEDDVTESNCENEVLHIFTPKKQKKGKGDPQSQEHSTKSVTPIKILNLNSSKETVCVRSPKTRNNEIKKKPCNSKKSKKEEFAQLAPIFMPKPVLEKSVIEARQKFLQSGVPEQLKKIVDKQKPVECSLEDYFPIVTHVQQISCHGDLEVHDTTTIQLDNHNDQNIGLDDLWKKDGCMKQFLDSCTYSVKSDFHNSITKIDRKHHKFFLKQIKDAYPEFPVYRTYNFLKEKRNVKNKGVKTPLQNKDDNVQDSSFEVLSEIVDIHGDSPEHFMWTDKYKANSSTEIIGNFKSVNLLKKWLLNWKEYNEEQGYFIKNSQNRIRRDSDSWYEDSDSHDSSRPLNNVTLLTGPRGCGKTSAVYAVATELSIKVLEVNASAKRTGKKLLSDLQEATQSHKVNRSKGLSLENSQDSDVCDKNHKRKQKLGKTYFKTDKKTVLSQKSEDTITNDSQKQELKHVMSLILIEDADLVFEQDDGFISALTQIVQYSKRPIIIVTGNMQCSHLQRFIQGNNVLVFKPLSPKMLGTWLDLLILVEKDNAYPKLGSCLLELCKGDIRKAIHTLQFWIGSSYHDTRNSVKLKTEISTPEDDLLIDENSASSWSEGETVSLSDGVRSDLVIFDVVKTFTSYCYEEDMKSRKSFKMQYPTILSNIWWNIPAIWKLENNGEVDKCKNVEKCAERVGKDLNEISKFLDILSVADCIQATAGICQTSLDSSLRPWLMLPVSSVSDSEDLSMYNRHERLESEWTYFAINTSLKQINRRVGGLDEFHNIDFTAPATKKIRERDTINKSHNALYEAIPSSNQLERRGLATDYLPSLRSVARIEKERADNNHKRNNRFCHYMRSLRIACDARILESLCSSLDTEQVSCSTSDIVQS